MTTDKRQQTGASASQAQVLHGPVRCTPIHEQHAQRGRGAHATVARVGTTAGMSSLPSNGQQAEQSLQMAWSAVAKLEAEVAALQREVVATKSSALARARVAITRNSARLDDLAAKHAEVERTKVKLHRTGSPHILGCPFKPLPCMTTCAAFV